MTDRKTNGEKLDEFLRMAQETTDNSDIKSILDCVGRDGDKQMALALIGIVLMIRFPNMFVGSALDAIDDIRTMNVLKNAPTVGTH